MDIVLFGPPACGKGTQAKFLTQIGYTQLSTGDLFRQHLKDETTIGLEIKELMAAGDLVPDRITIQMVLMKVMSPRAPEHLIFDGFPRTVEQAKAFDVMMEECQRDVGPIVNLMVPHHTLVERMLKRAQEENRPEDNRETFEHRLAEYHRLTEPVLDYFGDRVTHLNGLRKPEEIADQIRNLLG